MQIYAKILWLLLLLPDVTISFITLERIAPTDLLRSTYDCQQSMDCVSGDIEGGGLLSRDDCRVACDHNIACVGYVTSLQGDCKLKWLCDVTQDNAEMTTCLKKSTYDCKIAQDCGPESIDIDVITERIPGFCAVECDNNLACVSYVVGPRGVCKLKSHCDSTQLNSDKDMTTCFHKRPVKAVYKDEICMAFDVKTSTMDMSLDECYNLCAESDECGAFDFTERGTCILKSLCEYTKTFLGSSTYNLAPVSTAYYNTMCWSPVLAAYTVTNQVQCYGRCKADSQCGAFVYYAEYKVCNLYSECPMQVRSYYDGPKIFIMGWLSDRQVYGAD